MRGQRGHEQSASECVHRRAAAVDGIAWLGRTALLWLLAALLAAAAAAPTLWHLRPWRKPDGVPQPVH